LSLIIVFVCLCLCFAWTAGITEIGRAAWKLKGRAIPLHVLDAEERAKANAQPHVAFYCPKYEDLKRRRGGEWGRVNMFFRVLAICHDVIPEHLGLYPIRIR
jgi:hypothetical protein